jgi:hypothetical protein
MMLVAGAGLIDPKYDGLAVDARLCCRIDCPFAFVTAPVEDVGLLTRPIHRASFTKETRPELLPPRQVRADVVAV